MFDRSTGARAASKATFSVAAVLALLPACSQNGSTTGPPQDQIQLQFSVSSLDLGEQLHGTVTLRNAGSLAAGPVGISVEQLLLGGTAVPGIRVIAQPDEVATLNPGGSTTIAFQVEADGTIGPGSYAAGVDAVVSGQTEASLSVGFAVLPPAVDVGSLVFIDPPATAIQGDVVHLVVEARDPTGQLIDDPQITWSLGSPGAGLVMADGRFVGYSATTVEISARLENVEATTDITVAPRNVPTGAFNVVGTGLETTRFTSDLWVHGDHAYTGTWADRNGFIGNTLNAWDISNPASPTKSGSVTVDALVVNDVKVRADGALAVITHEISSDLQNGITLLDLADPAQPQVIRRFTAGLQAGVHNVWVEGDHIYIVTDGVGNGLRVVNIADPANPVVVATFADPASFLHDVYVRDGLAFLSHWNSGLIILDVGNGVAGGSPAAPREVGRIRTAGGQTHNAWYWPERGYVFVGEEDFGTPGIMHVVDASDLANPVEVATFRVPGDTPHNFWLDEDRGILYMAWYSNGLLAIDVSGELLGELDRQGRQIADATYGTGFDGCPGGVTSTCAWAPQLYDGLIYVADLNTGLWVLQPTF